MDFKLVSDYALDVVLCGLRCTLQRLTFCQDHRHRRPQLVAGVRGKLRLRLKGAFHSCGVQDMPVEMAAFLPSTVMRQSMLAVPSAFTFCLLT